MTKHLFLFTIAPVQSFIAQSRKAQDLYAASRLLTELIKEAIIQAQNSFNAAIIFPFVEADIINATSLPNRFLAIVPPQEQDWQIIGGAIEQKVRQKWANVAQTTVLDSLAKLDSDKIKTDFDIQIQNHLEIYWVFEPIQNGYSIAYTRIEKLMGAVKNTRYFVQQPEQGRKCSLDGQNNALFFGKGTNSNYIKNAIVWAGDGLNENEGLSAVSMMKRLFEKDLLNTFPSTATIATMDAQHIASKIDTTSDLLQKFIDYRNLFTANIFNHQLYYDENLTKKYFKEQNIRTNLELAQDKLKILADALIEKDVKFGKYYAIICFDGDRMGEILSGACLKDRSNMNIDLPKFQNYLSQLLRNFAKWASEKYLINPKGKAIYAGGDDFLGFVNLRYLFEVMEDLRRNFECHVNAPLQKRYELEKELNSFAFSFSAGIAIAHYKEPLGLVLASARHAQDIAKEKGERDAFCIIAAKHSGENHETYLKWHYEHLQDLKNLLTYRLEDKISSKFFRMLGLELRRLEINNESAAHKSIVEAELKRLLKRAKSNDMGKKTIQNFADKLIKIYDAMKDLNRFLQLLYIVDFMARELKFAEKELVQP